MCLNCISLSPKGVNRLVRLKAGESFTISCNPMVKPQESLILHARLDKNDTDVLFLDLNKKTLIARSALTHRLKYTENGDRHTLLITISNLTVEDTNIYWCEYSRFDPNDGNVLITDGGESVLLVVDSTCPAAGVFCYFVNVNLSELVLLQIDFLG